MQKQVQQKKADHHKVEEALVAHPIGFGLPVVSNVIDKLVYTIFHHGHVDLLAVWDVGFGQLVFLVLGGHIGI